MKWNQIIIIIVFFGVSAGCSKNPADIPTPDPTDSSIGKIPIPYDYEGHIGTRAYHPYPAYIGPATGVFIVDRERRILRDSTLTVSIEDKVWNTAAFLGANGIGGANGGDVQFNNASLVYSPPHIFYMNTDASLWNATGANTWSVTGNAHIPAISQVIDTTFPRFTGSLPDTMTINSNFTFTFDNSNLQHANGAYLIVYDSNMRFVNTNLAGPSGGTVSYNYGAAPPVNSWLWMDNKKYYGVWIEVICYNYETHQFNGKPFAFVRQSRLLKNVVVKQ